MGGDNQVKLQQLGQFLTDNLQNFIQLRKTQNSEPRIYVQRILFSQANSVYTALQQSFSMETRSFQYFFCDKNTTYHDLMLFINRFLHLHIVNNFYLIDFQNCNAQLRDQIADKLYQITKHKTDPSNNKLIIFSMLRSSSDRVEMQQYEALLP